MKKLGRVLLTNDDGFDAPGIAALADAAASIADEIWIAAPHIDQSGMGQCLTINNPLRITGRGDKKWAVYGTPADCVILGLSHLMLDSPPDLVLSGVNAGENTGDDTNVSGTIGAALTGVMMGVPSIAISMACASRKNILWDTARASLPAIITRLWQEGWDKNNCLSINLPDLPADKIAGVTWTHPARKTMSAFHVEQREDLREKDYYWIYPRSDKRHVDHGCDVAALARGEVSVSALTLNRGAHTITAPHGKKTANDE